MIPCSNPRAQYAARKDEIDRAVRTVMERGRYILGPEVEAFEAEFAAYIGVKHAIGVGSGTDALNVALRACQIVPGDEVITVSHTAVATVAAIEMAGAVPALVDINPVHYTIASDKIEAAITPRTKAIIPVHLYGQPADLDPILEIAKKHGLRVIEDCAQSHGAVYKGRRTGSCGDLACFSFYPTKNLGAIGDGGMVVSNDDALSSRARLVRQYGWARRYISDIQGVNTRLDEIQAAILRIKLRYLDQDNQFRQRLARSYAEKLSGTDLTLPAAGAGREHVFHLYVVRSSRRDQLLSHLQAKDVGALVHYPVPVHLQPAYLNRIPAAGLAETERAAREVLSLPMYPELSESELKAVANAVLEFRPQGPEKP
ncbi:MAG: DegT/DnrJ/EryC1/StrS family aminotransferase [Elusimicrobia bacterium]|nr:DegT/DnrJ/EryC1/StrS family aminotransferase [Elusimicrobiota bacterium]